MTLWAHSHHADDFPHLWCAGLPGTQQELIASGTGRFFRPPYVGGRGWIGVRLDGDVDWAEIAELCHDGYRVIAPARLAALLDSWTQPSGRGAAQNLQFGNPPNSTPADR